MLLHFRFIPLTHLVERSRRWLGRASRTVTTVAAVVSAKRRELDRAIVIQAALIVVIGGFVVGLFLSHAQFAALLGRGGAHAPASVVRAEPSQDAGPSRSKGPVSQRGLLAQAPTVGVFAPARPPFSRLWPTLSLDPPVDAPDAETLRAGARTLPLAFVRSAPRGEICLDRFLNRGLCDDMGQVALERLVAPIGAECRPVFYTVDDVRYQCFAGSVDVAGRLVSLRLIRRDGMARALLAPHSPHSLHSPRSPAVPSPSSPAPSCVPGASCLSLPDLRSTL